MKIVPTDVTELHSIIKDTNFITVVDPRHSNSSFHYTAWCKKDIKSLLDLTSSSSLAGSRSGGRVSLPGPPPHKAAAVASQN